MMTISKQALYVNGALATKLLPQYQHTLQLLQEPTNALIWMEMTEAVEFYQALSLKISAVKGCVLLLMDLAQ